MAIVGLPAVNFGATEGLIVGMLVADSVLSFSSFVSFETEDAAFSSSSLLIGGGNVDIFVATVGLKVGEGVTKLVLSFAFFVSAETEEGAAEGLKVALSIVCVLSVEG